MTSTTSSFEKWFMQRGGILVLPLVMAIALIACNEAQQPPVVKTRIATTSPQTEPQEQPKSPPTGTAPADKSDDDERESPYFGSTYWDELLTSVYYYPDSKATHLKFNHRDDEIWLCGDQRRNFEPGNRYRLTVTFEPNAPCITNWRVK